jgi:hypothetical protein
MLVGKIFLLFALSGVGGQATPRVFQNTESAKIEFLLNEVEKLDRAKFWRNGSSHSAKDAADHLRMKWKKAGGAVKTAKDFIDKVGSASSLSGNAYLIQFANGTKTEARAFFYQRLALWKP